MIGNSRSVYVPLHIKSYHSRGVGTASPRELAQLGSELGYGALALTDLENLCGQIEFHHACRERGLKPITGVELRAGFDGSASSGRREGRLVLLAADRSGYAELCRIVSRRRAADPAVTEANPTPHPVRSLDSASGDVFVLTDDPALGARLPGLPGVDPSRVGLLLTRPRDARQNAGSEAELIEVSRSTGLPLVANLDVVMARSADRELHALVTAVRRGETVGQASVSGELASGERHLRGPAEVGRLFGDLPEALDAPARIADDCSLDLTRSPDGVSAPSFASGPDAESELERRCARALREGRDAGRWRSSRYAGRLERELATIRKMGLGGYFLVVAEVARRAAERRIEVSARGSAVSSLVAHLLGITEVDPLEHGLYFERFLHPARAEPPDIDLDVASDRRDELIDWVFRRFGRERVAMVSAHQHFRRRSAFREGLKALGMPVERVREYCDRLPRRGGPSSRAGAPPLPGRYAGFEPLLERMIGIPRHLSVHPGGLVIAEREIHRRVSLERAPKGVVVTQYDMRSLQHTGLVKLDLLGSRALSEMHETLELVRQRSGAAAPPEEIGSIPEDDRATLGRLDRGETVGCFQVESPAMRSTLRRIPVRDAGDVVDALALVRPGASAGDSRERFIRRARGEEAPEFPHPRLREALRATHGILLYEEDVLAVLIEVLGIGAAEADEIRSAITAAGSDSKAMDRIRRRFLEGALDKGFPPDAARHIWAQVEKFAAYSFSRAHAASYALMAYRTAYLKTHYPVEFGCALLNHHGGMYPLRSIAAEIVRSGVELLPPCVNRSELPCSVEERPPARSVRIGLGKLKRISGGTVRAILASRAREGEFEDLSDLRERVSIGAAELDILVRSGACDRLPPISSRGYPLAREPHGDARAEEPVARHRALVRIRNELECLGMHVRAHPMRILRFEAARHDCITTADALSRGEGFVRLAAILSASRRVLTSGGDPMQFLTLEDETGLLEAVLFPAVYERYGERVTTPGPYLVAGTLREEHGDVQLTVARLKPFHERDADRSGASRQVRSQRLGP